MSRRYLPNIIITGTPGCGKTSHAESLITQLGSTKLNHISISDFAKERNCIDSYDSELETSVVDEDKLLDELEPELEKGGVIVDWHCCDVFPERLIDLVVVLRTDNSILFDRLSKRGYNEKKLQENLDCEIMDVISQEAQESYIKEIVIELGSNSVEEMEGNVERVAIWVENWVKQNENGATNVLSEFRDERAERGEVVGDESEESDEELED